MMTPCSQLSPMSSSSVRYQGVQSMGAPTSSEGGSRTTLRDRGGREPVVTPSCGL